MKVFFYIYFLIKSKIDNLNEKKWFKDDYQNDDMSIYTPSPEKGVKNYNVWTSGDSSFINNSSIVSTSIRPAKHDYNTDSSVTSSDCSSISDNKKEGFNISALSLITAVGMGE